MLLKTTHHSGKIKLSLLTLVVLLKRMSYKHNCHGRLRTKQKQLIVRRPCTTSLSNFFRNHITKGNNKVCQQEASVGWPMMQAWSEFNQLEKHCSRIKQTPVRFSSDFHLRLRKHLRCAHSDTHTNSHTLRKHFLRD